MEIIMILLLIFWLGPKVWDGLILPIINYPREILGKDPLPKMRKKTK